MKKNDKSSNYKKKTYRREIIRFLINLKKKVKSFHLSYYKCD